VVPLDTYVKYYEQVKDAKRESTLYTEKIIIGHRKDHLGQVRLGRITRPKFTDGDLATAPSQALAMPSRMA
jgi:hypothetical protein